MKKTLRIAAILATVICALICFCGCTKYNAVYSAFAKAGYSESDTVASYQEELKKYFTSKDENGNETTSSVTLHVLYKGDTLLKQTVVIAEFLSTKELEEQYKNSTDLQNFVKDLNNSDYVNGNCVLLINLSTDGLTIFKNA